MLDLNFFNIKVNHFQTLVTDGLLNFILMGNYCFFKSKLFENIGKIKVKTWASVVQDTEDWFCILHIQLVLMLFT